jgi:hypothetical protein
MEEQRTCLSWWKCGAIIEGDVAECPHCGGQVASPREMRIRGSGMIGIGIFLILVMLYGAWIVTGWYFEPEVAARPQAILGLLLSYAFFGSFAFFGVLAIRAGTQMRENGQMSLKLRGGMMWFLGLFFAAGLLSWIVAGLV